MPTLGESLIAITRHEAKLRMGASPSALPAPPRLSLPPARETRDDLRKIQRARRKLKAQGFVNEWDHTNA